MSTSHYRNRESGPDEEFRWWAIDFSDVLFLLRRHFLAIVLIPLLVATGGYGLSRLVRPVFTSTAVVYLRPNFDKEMQLERTFSKLEDADSLRSVETAMVSDTVILKTIDRLGLRNDESFIGEPLVDGRSLSDAGLLKEIRKRYETKMVPNTRLVELSVDDFDPARAKLIAETMIREFLDHLGEEREIKEKELRETLVEQAETALEEALASEKKLEDFRSRHSGLIVEQDSSIFHERLLQYGKALNDASSEQSSLEGMVAALDGVDPLEDPYRIFQVLKNLNSEYLSELLAMHATAKSQFATVKQRFTEEHPSYRESASNLEEVESTLRNYAAEMKSGLESEFQAAKRKSEKLLESMIALQDEFIAFKSTSAEFRGIKEKIDRSWNTHTKLQEKITDLDLNPEADLNFITLISKPIVPDKKSSPVGLIWVGAAGILGCVFVGLRLMIRYRDGLPFSSPAQVTEILGIPVLDEIRYSGRKGGGLEFQADQGFNIAIPISRCRIIHVVSPGGIGGQDLAGSIGEVFANQGMKTLLVNLQYQKLVVENQIRSTDHWNLSEIDLSANRLLDPDGFREGLDRSLQSFDRILIDASSIRQKETLVSVSAVAEASVLLVERGRESREIYRGFLDRMRHSGANRVFGVFLSGVCRTGLRGWRWRAPAFHFPKIRTRKKRAA